MTFEPVETKGADVTLSRDLISAASRILPEGASTLIVAVAPWADARACYLDADRRVTKETPIALTTGAGNLIATFTSEMIAKLPSNQAQAVARLLDARQISLAVLVDVLAEHISLSVLRPNQEPGVLAYVKLQPERTH